MSQRFPWARGIRVSIRNNASAYAYSVAITTSFAALQSRHGPPTIPQLFCFALGAALAFTVVEAAGSRGFRDRIRPERSEVVVLGSAMAPFSVGCSLGAAVLAGALVDGWLGWALGSFAATTVYIVASGVEMGLARLREERRPPEGEA